MDQSFSEFFKGFYKTQYDLRSVAGGEHLPWHLGRSHRGWARRRKKRSADDETGHRVMGSCVPTKPARSEDEDFIWVAVPNDGGTDDDDEEQHGTQPFVRLSAALVFHLRSHYRFWRLGGCMRSRLRMG
jgi:hypothetical protein